MTTRALVLAGGGARGAFQVGMIRELTRTRDFQVIRGVSVGAINGGFLAQAPAQGDARGALNEHAVKLEQIWGQLGGALSAAAGKAPQDDPFGRMVAMGEALKQFIGTIISGDRLAASGRDFTAGYVSLPGAQYREAKSTETDILELIRASAALPPLFPWVMTRDDLLVDGGYRNVTPLASAFKAKPKPDEIYVLLTRRIDLRDDRLSNTAIEPQALDPDWGGRTGDPQKFYAQVSDRLVDILMDEVYIEDIKRAIEVNSLARALERLERGAAGEITAALRRPPKYVKLYVLAPRQRFNPAARMGYGDTTAEFNPDLIRDAIEHGAAVAADESQWVWHPGREARRR
jgi:NTE family protein